MARLRVIAAMLDEFCADKGLAPGSIKLIALIRIASGVGAVAGHYPRGNAGRTGVGHRGLLTGARRNTAARCTGLSARQIALAAAMRGLMALAVPISIAEFRDIDAYKAAATRAGGFGVTGAICIHPAVNAANQCFQPERRSHRQGAGHRRRLESGASKAKR